MNSATRLKELIQATTDIRILYVEDDESLRENTRRLLSTFFDNLDCAENGQIGIEKYDGGEYDIVISDLRMPVMDGIEMVKRIKKLKEDQLIIITSAHDESDYLLELIRAGVESFILKPLDVNQFLSALIKIVRIINLRRMEEEYKSRLEKTVRERTEELSRANTQLEKINATLEETVHQRTRELKKTLEDVEIVNHRLMDSIEYAKMIQRSLLPNPEEINQHLPDSFIIWLPRDGVGGDIYYLDFFDNSYIISIIDCTGHGVPGALMTMIASSGLRQIIRDEQIHDPSEALKRLNSFIKKSLQQDTEYAQSNDGLDAGICHVEPDKKRLSFAGAKQSLVYLENDTARIIKGDKESIGYKTSNLEHDFSKTVISYQQGARCFLFSDGYPDQIGEASGFGFGRKRFVSLLQKTSKLSFDNQKDTLINEFTRFRGNNETRDDVTIIGFGF